MVIEYLRVWSPYLSKTRAETGMRIFIAIIATLTLVSSAALAKPPLREVSEVDDGVMHIAIADEIRKSCDDISARLIRAYSTLSSLKSLARDLGYSDEEIEDYVTSKDEKTRMRAKAERFLAANGVSADDTPGLCRFGKRQIQSQTEIGRLLR